MPMLGRVGQESKSHLFISATEAISPRRLPAVLSRALSVRTTRTREAS